MVFCYPLGLFWVGFLIGSNSRISGRSSVPEYCLLFVFLVSFQAQLNSMFFLLLSLGFLNVSAWFSNCLQIPASIVSFVLFVDFLVLFFAFVDGYV